MVNLLQIVKTAIQAVVVILVPAKIAASTKAVFHAGYEKLLIAAFHSALAIWVVTSLLHTEYIKELLWKPIWCARDQWEDHQVDMAMMNLSY